MSEYWIENEDGEKVYIDFLYALYNLKRVPLFFKYKLKYYRALADIDVWERENKWIKVDPSDPPLLINTDPEWELWSDNVEEIKALYDEAKSLGLLNKISEDRVEIRIASQAKINSWWTMNYLIMDRWQVFQGDTQIQQRLNYRMEEYFKNRFGGDNV